MFFIIINWYFVKYFCACKAKKRTTNITQLTELEYLESTLKQKQNIIIYKSWGEYEIKFPDDVVVYRIVSNTSMYALIIRKSGFDKSLVG